VIPAFDPLRLHKDLPVKAARCLSRVRAFDDTRAVETVTHALRCAKHADFQKTELIQLIDLTHIELCV
jgi:hypothetical protein